MSRKPRIDWSKGGKDELKAAIRNFNAKITRLAKKDPKNAGSLPEKVKLSYYVGTKNKPGLIQTRQDLKREIKSLKRFSIKGAEELIELPDNDYGTKITKWQKKEISIGLAVINRRRNERKKLLESIELESGGQQLGYTLGDIGMGKEDINQVKPMKGLSRTASNRDVKAKMRTIRRERQSTYYDDKDDEVKENYIKGLLTHYNQEDIKDIEEAIKNMDIKEFMKRFRRAGNTFEIVSPIPGGAMKDQKAIDYEGYVNLLKSTWIPDVAPTGLAKQARELTGNEKIKGRKVKKVKEKKV